MPNKKTVAEFFDKAARDVAPTIGAAVVADIRVEATLRRLPPYGPTSPGDMSAEDLNGVADEAEGFARDDRDAAASYFLRLVAADYRDVARSASTDSDDR